MLTYNAVDWQITSYYCCNYYFYLSLGLWLTKNRWPVECGLEGKCSLTSFGSKSPLSTKGILHHYCNCKGKKRLEQWGKYKMIAFQSDNYSHIHSWKIGFKVLRCNSIENNPCWSLQKVFAFLLSAKNLKYKAQYKALIQWLSTIVKQRHHGFAGIDKQNAPAVSLLSRWYDISLMPPSLLFFGNQASGGIQLVKAWISLTSRRVDGMKVKDSPL